MMTHFNYKRAYSKMYNSSNRCLTHLKHYNGVYTM